MARELQAEFAQESKRRETGSLAEDPHQGRAGDPGFRGKRVERPGRAGAINMAVTARADGGATRSFMRLLEQAPSAEPRSSRWLLGSDCGTLAGKLADASPTDL
jgi:hypothetical protein